MGCSAPHLRVTDPSAIDLLFDLVHARRLAAFVQRDRAVAEVARWMHEDIRRTHRAVERYRALGLVHEVGRRERRGRPQRLYRSVADKFFVAAEDLPAHPADVAEALVQAVAAELVHDAYAAIDRSFDRPRGRLFEPSTTGETLHAVAAFDPHGGMSELIDRFSAESTPAVWSSSHLVRLTRAEAKLLQRAMIALAQEIEARRSAASPAAQTYRTLLMMAPRDDGSGRA